MKPPTNDIIPQGFKMTELGVLPEEWEVVRLGEYCNVFSGYAFKSDDFCNNGVLVVKIGNLQNGSIVFNTKESFFPREKINDDISKFILNEGDILIALTGATTGKISLVPKSVNGALLNQRVGKFSIYNDLLYKSFARYYFLTDEFQNHIKINIMQSAQGNISPKQIETFPIPLPPLPEQQKIAAVLSAVQEAKEKTEAVIAAAKALKKSMMKHLFTYGPVSPQKAETVSLKETEIGMVPEEWEVAKVSDVIERTQYGISLRGNQEGQYPILRMNNLIDGRIDTSDLQYVALDENSFKKFQLNKGDVLFNRTNSYELVGKTALFDSSDNLVFASYLVRVVPDISLVLPEYLNYYLNWSQTQTRLKMLASRGVSQSNINATKLRGFSISLPSTSEQIKITTILSTVDRKIEAEENKKKALEDLFKSLLHNLMTAKIRVNHLGVTL